MSPTVTVATALIAALAGVTGSLVAAYWARPKTRAEADNLNAAASVSVSADARAWSKLFVDRAKHAEDRADAAESRADAAEHRADEVEAGLIECYGYVRQLRDEIRRLDGHVPPLPSRLETLWRATGH